MNAATYDHLRLFTNAARVLRHIVPDLPPVPFIEATDSPWPAVDEARYFCERLGAWSPGRHAPHAYAHWHRIAWQSVVLAAAEAAGQGLAGDELARLDRMTTPELADELTYMADHQG